LYTTIIIIWHIFGRTTTTTVDSGWRWRSWWLNEKSTECPQSYTTRQSADHRNVKAPREERLTAFDDSPSDHPRIQRMSKPIRRPSALNAIDFCTGGDHNRGEVRNAVADPPNRPTGADNCRVLISGPLGRWQRVYRWWWHSADGSPFKKSELQSVLGKSASERFEPNQPEARQIVGTTIVRREVREESRRRRAGRTSTVERVDACENHHQNNDNNGYLCLYFVWIKHVHGS